jgi:hypothetical protein
VGAHGGKCAGEQFISDIGDLLPMAPCGRNSLFDPKRRSSLYQQANRLEDLEVWITANRFQSTSEYPA